MKVPSSFQMLGHTYQVRVIRKELWKDPTAVAFFDSSSKEVMILKASATSMQHAFLHELMHAVTLAMGRDRLYKDEAFIDMAAGLLHQALTSAK